MKLTARLARLTLYSGPNCSLCDVAKSELAKVRQTRNFELDVVNIHDPGQERWRKKYACWIPALHIEGKEVAKGRWDAQTVIHALDLWQTSDKQGYHNDYPYFLSPPFYERCTANVLGADDEDELPLDEGVSRCFNCGSAYHIVSSCLVPHNTELITLSRQMYNFFNPSRSTGPMTISAAAEFTNQRHQWLGSFEPGQVRGSVLREALGLDDGDVGSELPWLKNMADWGYPRGWFSEEDPREQVLRRVDDLFAEPLDLGGHDHSLAIFGDDGVEFLGMGVQPFRKSSSHEATDRSRNFRDSPVMRPDPYRAEQVEIGRSRRWASYPSTYFSSDLLPIYNGTRLPPILPTTSSTFTSERHILWESILDEVDSFRVRELRGPHDTRNIPQHVPHPPTAPPPPLPPLPPLVPAADVDDVQKGGESDMELSDSDY